MTSGSNAKYPTLSTDGIKNLIVNDTSIQKLGDKNSVLFLWIPVALLPEGLDVMKSWGYTYKTSIFWVKTNKRPGIGFTYRNKVEQCLFGKRGKLPAFRSPKPNVIFAQSEQHSKKPVEFFEHITPELTKFNLEPKIELFAREVREGWDGWGLDYPVRGQ